MADAQNAEDNITLRKQQNNKKMKYLLSLLISACTVMCQAVKMYSGIKTIKQSDGTTITIKGFGNQDLNYFCTTDGVLLYQDGTDFYIAGVEADGMLYSTGVLAHDAGKRDSVEIRLITAQNKEHFMNSIQSNVGKARIRREPLTPNSTLLPHTGSPRVPVILVEFSDTTFTVSDPKAVFDKYLNATELFDKTEDSDMTGNYGSVKRYFTDMSFGKFSPDFDVYGPVTLGQPLKYYGGGSSASENMADLLKDACSAVDDDVDFSQYDSNGDGYIDLVYVIYAGYSESFTGNSTECIYPKSGTLANGAEFDGKKICRYGVNNELNGTPAEQMSIGLLLNGIGLFCHEFSHCLGLPDLYPSPTNVAVRCINQNLDYWDLMDAGEYLKNGYFPTEYTAWERERFGWMTIDTLKSPCNVTLTPVSAGGKAYRILNDKDETGKEYYIVENVQKTGWNRYLNGHGMLVFHVDYDDYEFSVGGCRVNNTAGHPRMALIAADGMFLPEYFIYETISEGSSDIEREVNADLIERYGGKEISPAMYIAEMVGDPYPGTAEVTALTDDTAPAVSWVYNGGYMGKPITDITEDTDSRTVSFKFMGGADTGIRSIKADNGIKGIFSIDGRYLGTEKSKLNKGLYIIGNRKVCL